MRGKAFLKLSTTCFILWITNAQWNCCKLSQSFLYLVASFWGPMPSNTSPPRQTKIIQLQRLYSCLVTIAAELCHRVGEGAFNEHIRQHIEHIVAFVRCGYWYDVTSEMMRRNLFSPPYHYHCCCKLVHTVEEKKAVKTSIYYHTEPFKKWYILILVYYYVNYFIWGTPTPTAAAATATAFRFHVDPFFALRSLLLYGMKTWNENEHAPPSRLSRTWPSLARLTHYPCTRELQRKNCCVFYTNQISGCLSCNSRIHAEMSAL